ncbi:MAG TPA: hypothetical protein VJ111_17940 [Chitinophagaceae bacterium]|nr:hypothetical protein [Chitinophagaceae bacterium]
MKIPSLLAQYFYTNRRLELPGLGSFVLDISSISALQHSKHRSAVLDGVSFESNVALKESPDLIAFIAQKTGKMKALASADLDSHLQLAQQFLNMGKPFSFEGIGILSRVKPGEFEFTPISVAIDKLKELHTSDVVSADTKEESSSQYESFLSAPKIKFEWKKPVIGVMLLCGVGLTIWGGYVISQKKNKTLVHTAAEKIVPGMIASDSLQKADSIMPIAQTIIAPENNYKYVLEIAKSKRAFKRYNQLKTIRWKVEMETKDSIQYKLYMLLPSLADTTRTMDSLTVMTGRRVYIEYAN